MNTSEKSSIVAEGSVHIKSSKLDCEYQDFAVRKWSDGFIEYYNTSAGEFSWCSLPKMWETKIRWDS